MKPPLPPYAGVSRIRFDGSEAAASLSTAAGFPSKYYFDGNPVSGPPGKATV
jgi:hypothetical protein